MFTVVSFSFCDHLVFSFCRKEKWFLHFHFFFFFYSPWTFDFFENFDQIPWHVGSLDGQMPHWLALQRASNPPIHQRLFKNFPMRQTVYSKCKYPTRHNQNGLKSQKAVILFIPESPHLTGIFKGSQMPQQNSEYRSNAERIKKSFCLRC